MFFQSNTSPADSATATTNPPPASNTGVGTPRADRLLLDYLRYSLPDGVNPNTVVPFHATLDWITLGHGRHGYKASVRAGSAVIYSDGAPGMGTCVELSGKAMREFEASPGFEGWECYLARLVIAGASFTRLDVAFDDVTGVFSLDTIADAVIAGDVVMKFREVNQVEQLAGGRGRTVTFGDRSSDVYIRWYDKAAEQDLPASVHWIRLELELKRDRAAAFINRWLNEFMQLGELVRGVIARYIEFKERGDDTHRHRWPIAPWWNTWLAGVSKLRLSLDPVVRNLATVTRWLERQVAPLLAVWSTAKGGDLGALATLLAGGRARWRPRHLALLSGTT